jgi:uncharacterized protein YceK
MLNRQIFTAPVFLMFLLSGCNHAANEAIAKQATHPGVYALTTSGLSEITQYGTAAVNPFTQEISFTFDHSVAQAVAPLGFVTNLPNAVAAESKVFLLPSLEAGSWHKNFTAAGDTKPIPSSADAISGSIYKVTPDELPNGATGFLCLWLKMPAGTADRMYAIRLK